jgi:hypothetical protein
MTDRTKGVIISAAHGKKLKHLSAEYCKDMRTIVEDLIDAEFEKFKKKLEREMGKK